MCSACAEREVSFGREVRFAREVSLRDDMRNTSLHFAAKLQSITVPQAQHHLRRQAQTSLLNKKEPNDIMMPGGGDSNRC